MTQQKLVSDYWGKAPSGARPTGWLKHPITRAYISKRISGEPKVDSLQYIARSYFSAPVDRALSLGCGFGGFEIAAIRANVAKHIDACDISEAAVVEAASRRDKAGLGDRISYNVVDINEARLERDRYDAIFGISGVHHVFNLEHLFGECKRALKPNGLLILDEYIGPSRFQSDQTVVTIINQIRSVLPERYRYNLFRDDGSILGAWQPPSISWFEQNDPSESVRSAEIVSTLKLYFNVVEMRPYGGALLHHLLSGIAGNFEPNNESDVVLLNVLTVLEMALEETGKIGSDFAVIVATPR